MNTNATINRPTTLPIIVWPQHLTATHRAKIEIKASLVETKYTISPFQTATGENSGRFALIPSTAKGIEANPFGYEVDLTDRPTCTCPGNRAEGICSHVLAVVDHIARDLWIVDMEAVLADFTDDRAAIAAEIAERSARPVPEVLEEDGWGLLA
jgi:hypothetical protein